MRLLSRVLVALMVVVLGWLAGASTEVATAVPAQAEVIYTYDAPAYAGPVAGAGSERGPPAPRHRCTTYDAVDLGSHGTSARPSALSTPVIYNYDGTARFVQTARGSHGVEGSNGGRSAAHAVSHRLRVAANAGDDTVSLFKASQRELGETHFANGYKPGDFPGKGAYFTKEREIADSYAKHYGEGVIETRVPRGVYDEHFAEYEMRYLGTPPGAELAIPPEKLDLLSQFERIWFR